MRVKITKIYQLDKKVDLKKLTLQQLAELIETAEEEGELVEERRDLIRNENT